MSGRAISWAFTFDDLTPTTKFVLVSICQYYNERVHGAWPSVAALAADTGLSERQVTRSIGTLREGGLIQVGARFDGHRQTTNDYFLPLYDAASDLELLGRIDRRAVFPGKTTSRSVTD